MKRVTSFLLILILLVSGVAAAGPREGLTSQAGPIHRTVYCESSRKTIQYIFPNGDEYLQHTAFSQDGGITLDFPAESCTVRYSAAGSDTWTVLYDPVAVTGKRTMFLEFDNGSAVFSPPQAYEKIEHGCLRSLPEQDGTLHLTRTESGWRITVELPQGKGQWNWFSLTSDAALMNWASPSQQKLWLGYQMTDTYRWCADGMYQLSPESYSPTGENVYFRNPASYIPVKYVLTDGSRAAHDLAIAMLDSVRRELNEDGWMPISTASGWLQTDFGIGHGYYDTRWCTDLAEGLYQAAEKFGISEFSDTVQGYADFLCRHIQAHPGILPPDYGWEEARTVTHASLNHLLAEALFLYHAGREDTADQLVAAICAQNWLREDGNLKYALMPDGTELGQDYPYLTYNDLFKLRSWYEEAGRAFPAQLQMLMDAKLLWMRKHGITGYLE